MRPIKKYDPMPTYFSEGLAYLLQRVGPYCAFCERSLPDECWLWDKDTGLVISSSQVHLHPYPWYVWSLPSCYVLDRNCALAHDERISYFQDVLVGHLLLPDDADPSFRLNDTSPIAYSLVTVPHILVGEDGSEISRDTKEVVIASGSTDNAIRTIEQFALNTRHYDATSNEFRFPATEFDAAFDRRVEQRTKTWEIAETFAGILAETGEADFQDVLIDECRRTAAATGFWSTWATVFRQRNLPISVLRRLLLPSDQRGWEDGPGPHNTFPGTRADWLS